MALAISFMLGVAALAAGDESDKPAAPLQQPQQDQQVAPAQPRSGAPRGVIEPPPVADRGVVKPPDIGATPVIPPPGTPGGNPTVQPK